MSDVDHATHRAETDPACAVCRRLAAIRGDALRPAETDDEPWTVPDGPSGMTCWWVLVGCGVWVGAGLIAVAIVLWWVRR